MKLGRGRRHKKERSFLYVVEECLFKCELEIQILKTFILESRWNMYVTLDKFLKTIPSIVKLFSLKHVG